MFPSPWVYPSHVGRGLGLCFWLLMCIVNVEREGARSCSVRCLLTLTPVHARLDNCFGRRASDNGGFGFAFRLLTCVEADAPALSIESIESTTARLVLLVRCRHLLRRPGAELDRRVRRAVRQNAGPRTVRHGVGGRGTFPAALPPGHRRYHCSHGQPVSLLC